MAEPTKGIGDCGGAWGRFESEWALWLVHRGPGNTGLVGAALAPRELCARLILESSEAGFESSWTRLPGLGALPCAQLRPRPSRPLGAAPIAIPGPELLAELAALSGIAPWEKPRDVAGKGLGALALWVRAQAARLERAQIEAALGAAPSGEAGAGAAPRQGGRL